MLIACGHMKNQNKMLKLNTTYLLMLLRFDVCANDDYATCLKGASMSLRKVVLINWNNWYMRFCAIRRTHRWEMLEVSLKKLHRFHIVSQLWYIVIILLLWSSWMFSAKWSAANGNDDPDSWRYPMFSVLQKLQAELNNQLCSLSSLPMLWTKNILCLRTSIKKGSREQVIKFLFILGCWCCITWI